MIDARRQRSGGLFLLLLAAIVVHLPAGSRRAGGGIVAILSLAAVVLLLFGHLRAPIGPAVEQALELASIMTLGIFGCRDVHAGSPRRQPRQGCRTQAANMEANGSGNPDFRSQPAGPQG
ncbi:MAG TPA: hypothetical protein VFW19_07025 [Allosphingosinicella sp.]|nr:hypothetical protein [Allosphingosinicella sp.]